MPRLLIFLLLFFYASYSWSQSVFLNEVMSNNIRLIDDQGENEDWIELYNASTETVELSNYYLSDKFSEPDKWQFPAETYIQSGDYLVIWADDDPSENDHLHCNFKLSKEGESLYLFQKNGGDYNLLDQIQIPFLPENSSYGRTIDGGEHLTVFGKYSLATSNNDNLPYNESQVQFSLEQGFYSAGTQLLLSSPILNAQIYYTTDGKRPDENDVLYTGEPISLDSTVFIRATLCAPDFAPSAPSAAFYLIDKTYKIPVVHIGTDTINLWDDYAGIYTTGDNGATLYCSTEKRNWNQPWKRRTTVTFFEENGEIEFSKPADIKISGNCSRTFKMKSLNVTLKNKATTEYPLFEHLPYTNYRQFKLRNSGNDSESTMLRDGAIQTVLKGQTDIDLMAYRPVVLYVNGSYFGIYGLREVFNEKYVQQHYEVEEADIYSNPWSWRAEIIAGDKEEFDVLSDWIFSTDLGVAANYEYLKSQVDVSQFMDYYLTQIYIANADWPDNNMRMWRDREREDAKWRWMLFDLDLSSDFELEGRCTGVQCNILADVTEEGQYHTKWIRKMLKNPDFFAEFMQRHCTIGQSIFSPERVGLQIDSLANLLRPEVATHINHWTNEPEEMGEWEWTPAGGSAPVWEDKISKFKSFFSERFQWSLEHFSAKFDKWEYFDLQINVEDSTQGKVVLHESKMAVDSDYLGIYFKNIPMRVEAVPSAGYRFVKWEETGSFESTFYLSANEDQTLTPIFVAEADYFPPLDENAEVDVRLFPNPAADELNYVIGYGRSTEVQLSIIDVIGQTVWKENITLNRHPKRRVLNLDSWSTGIYFFKLVIDNEEVIKKLVVL